MARSRSPLSVEITGAFSRVCACWTKSQFPGRTPTDFALLTRAMLSDSPTLTISPTRAGMILWSFGVMFYELLIRRHPSSGIWSSFG
jgi:hypothetical protein